MVEDETEGPERIVIGEFQFAEPSYRIASRLVALKEDDKIRFALENQHGGEPGAWVPETSFAWQGDNLDTLIWTVLKYYDQIQEILPGSTPIGSGEIDEDW